MLENSLPVQHALCSQWELYSSTPMTSIITCQSSAQENCDANNAVTRAAGHTPDEEEQPIQAKAAYQTRNTTPSAASTGRTAQGGSKTAGCGEEHSRRRITSQHKTTGNMSRPLDINEQSANNSASPQRQQQVNSRTDQSMRGTRQQQGPQSSWTAQLKSPWHETQDGGAAEDAVVDTLDTPQPECSTVQKQPHRHFSTVFWNKLTIERLHQWQWQWQWQWQKYPFPSEISLSKMEKSSKG